MSVKINGRKYYRTGEVCHIVGIGKSTLLRWIRNDIVREAEYRDRKGWRLFTENELRMLLAEGSRIEQNGTGGMANDRPSPNGDGRNTSR